MAARATTRADLSEEELGRVPPGRKHALDLAGVALEVAGVVGVVGDEDGGP